MYRHRAVEKIDTEKHKVNVWTLMSQSQIRIFQWKLYMLRLAIP